ncbi:hypothetical protein Q0M94_25345 (plasmid) [Deinococcus radiomollis]|uniref:hypothetical protein n=1 Tax=Deinococcus radiomollis TaxID=468916 RepID=UPI0038929513
MSEKQLTVKQERLVLDTIGDLKRTESLVSSQQTLAQIANPKKYRSFGDKIRSHYQKHRKFFNAIGVINSFFAWTYASFIVWLLVTLIILGTTLKLYSNGTWLENDVWLIILFIGVVSGMVSAFFSITVSIFYKIPSVILNACSVGLLGVYTAYQAYKSNSASKIIKDSSILIEIQFYLTGLIISVILYLICALIISLLRYLINKYKTRSNVKRI